jgi:hypothetical protein
VSGPSTSSSSVVLAPPQTKVQMKPQPPVKKAAVKPSSRASADTPVGDEPSASAEKDKQVKKPKKLKRKTKPTDTRDSFDPTGLTDKSLHAPSGVDEGDVPDALNDSLLSQSRVHRRTRSVDGMRLLMSGTLQGNGTASVTVMDARSGLTGSLELQAHQESELDAAMAALRVRTREDAASLDVVL